MSGEPGLAPASLPRLHWVRRAPEGIGTVSPPGVGGRPRLGVLGGTFNPVTSGHLELAGRAQKEFALEEVLFLLPQALPHRQPEEAGLEERLALLEIALRDSPRFSLALSSHGLLLDMSRALRPHYPPSTELYFLLGNDAAGRILAWDYPDRERALREMFSGFDLIVAVRRGEWEIPTLPELEPYRGQIQRLELSSEVQEISATAVREAAGRGAPLQGLVPAAVEAAIRKRGLYRSAG